MWRLQACGGDRYNFCRDVCGQYFFDHPVTIGGLGRVVEINELKFGRRKYNHGTVVDGYWVFGGVERGTSRAFMVEVVERSKHTLLPIIQQYILPGTTIISDEWRVYHDIGTLPGYTHQTMNQLCRSSDWGPYTIH